MTSLPIGSVEVATVAVPPLNAEVPRIVLPLVKVTVPVAPAGTLAVKVTDCPVVDGFNEDVKVTTGVALPTV